MGDPEVINRLTDMVNKDPYFELPPGYTKVKAERIREVNGIDPAIYPKES